MVHFRVEQDVNYDESANFKPQGNTHNMNVIQHGSYDYFFFLSRRTDYKHNYLVQCQIRSQILVIRLRDYQHLKKKDLPQCETYLLVRIVSGY